MKSVNGVIISNIITVNKSELTTLVANNELMPGSQYKLTDALMNLYNEKVTVILTAATVNTFELQAAGVFYTVKYDKSDKFWGVWNKMVVANITNLSNPDQVFYNGEMLVANNGAMARFYANYCLEYISGDWVNATTCSGQWSGITATIESYPWNPTTQPNYSTGSLVRYGNKMWMNVSGNIGQDESYMFNYPDGFYLTSADWQLLSQEDYPQHYNEHIDIIKYDFKTDTLLYREDKYGNKVDEPARITTSSGTQVRFDSSILCFQWGNPALQSANYDYSGCMNNIVTLNAKVDNISSFANFNGNTFTTGTTLNNIRMTGVNFSNNIFNNSGIFSIYSNPSSGNINGCDFTGTNINSLAMSNSNLTQILASNSQIGDLLSMQSFIIGNMVLINSGLYSIRSAKGFGMNNNFINGSNLQGLNIQDASFSNNTVNYSYISSLTLAQTSFENNNIEHCYLQNNYFRSSGFARNNLFGAEINYNNFTDTSGYGKGGLIGNITTQQFEIGYQTPRVKIENNQVSGSFSQISGNVMGLGSNISNNTLAANATISYNTLENYCTLSNNSVYSNSQINSNKLRNEGAYIQNCTLNNSSRVSTNQLLGQNSYIENNTLDSSAAIENNTLNGAFSAIYLLQLQSYSTVSFNILANSSVISNTVLIAAGLNSCILQASAVVQSTGGGLNSVTVQAVTFENFIYISDIPPFATNIFTSVPKTAYLDTGNSTVYLRWVENGNWVFKVFTD